MRSKLWCYLSIVLIPLFCFGCKNSHSIQNNTLKEIITQNFYDQIYLPYCEKENLEPARITDNQFDISEVRMSYKKTYVLRFSLINEKEQSITLKYDGYEWNDYTGINKFYVWHKYNVHSVEYCYQNNILTSEYFYKNEVLQKMIADTPDQYREDLIHSIYKSVWEDLNGDFN